MFFVAEIFKLLFLSLLNVSYLSLLNYLRICTTFPGGHKGDKDGYTIPAGTDVFISVSTNICDTCFIVREWISQIHVFYDSRSMFYTNMTGSTSVHQSHSNLQFQLESVTVGNPHRFVAFFSYMSDICR